MSARQPTRPRRWPPCAAATCSRPPTSTPTPGVRLLELAAALKARVAGHRPPRREPLRGRAVALVFEHPSLRTRVSTELAVGQLGGQSVYLVRR